MYRCTSTSGEDAVEVGLKELEKFSSWLPESYVFIVTFCKSSICSFMELHSYQTF